MEQMVKSGEESEAGKQTGREKYTKQTVNTLHSQNIFSLVILVSCLS